MRIGLIDVDGHNFPNIPLMKISAFNKALGNSVEWYNPLISGHMDRVYMAKVFSDSLDYPYYVDADVIIKGGSGYCISLVDGKEVFDKSKDIDLPYREEHIYPDYSIYGITDTAYGFLTRGCPRGCAFCHVKAKEGLVSRKVADLYEFWRGQKNIVLCDPNLLACKKWENLLQQLIDSKVTVDFNQGLDIRLMTERKAEMINQIKMKGLHFAWDRYEDKDKVLPNLEAFSNVCKIQPRNVTVYVLCNFNTTFEQDLNRIYAIREIGFSPYVMLYNKQSIPRGHQLKKLQRWVNSRYVFWSCERFEDYKA